ncbi:LysR family transcriptional regulator [Paracoccus sp. (in: a-proteobacteria)]|uniref:LysR family transcriptional regulator n=1 Tax=Paracoccus sp. TaxID=267 RepID=UPI00272CAB84|nr:LysR family transcriptional regulator [Paracoccus sp. (in: a-proteobacteria)]
MDIKALRAFVAIVEEGSFTAAARRLRLSKAMCSKLISDLEADLGARLLMRTTRAVKPNAAGTAFYAEIADILARLDAAAEGVRASTQRPSGPLKLSAPVQYMLNVFQPHLLRFMREFPEIRLETVLDDSRSDLVRDGFDAIIRIGPLDDSALHARRLHDVPTLMVASPAYIREHGAPAHPAELRDHACLHYSNLRGSNTWPLSINGEVSYHKINPIFSSNNTELLRLMALNGQGVALTPRFHVEDDLRQGLLLPVMPDYEFPRVPVNVLYSSRKNVSAALAAFLDFIGDLRLDADAPPDLPKA